MLFFQRSTDIFLWTLAKLFSPFKTLTGRPSCVPCLTGGGGVAALPVSTPLLPLCTLVWIKSTSQVLGCESRSRDNLNLFLSPSCHALASVRTPSTERPTHSTLRVSNGGSGPPRGRLWPCTSLLTEVMRMLCGIF